MKPAHSNQRVMEPIGGTVDYRVTDDASGRKLIYEVKWSQLTILFVKQMVGEVLVHPRAYTLVDTLLLSDTSLT